MTNEEALLKAIELYGPKAFVCWEPFLEPNRPYIIYRPPYSFWEGVSESFSGGYIDGVVVGQGASWETAFSSGGLYK